MAGTLEKLRAGCRPDRRALFSLGAMLFVFGNMAWGKISPGNLRCEYMENPAVVDTRAPRLSWINHASSGQERGRSQQAYRIVVSDRKSVV